MKYKLINTGNTDQHIPISHGKKKEGVMGSAGNLPKKLVIPGKARVEDGKNCLIVSEETLRGVFGLFERVKAGVVDPNKPCAISPKNVKLNSRVLDTGRIIVVDERGTHLFGIGGDAYQKNALDSLKDENQTLKDQFDKLVQVLVNDGYSEDQARAIVEGKASDVQEILKKKDSKVTGKGMAPLADRTDNGKSDGESRPETKLSEMTIPQLKEYAENCDPVIDLGDASKKADILAKINETVVDSDDKDSDDKGDAK